jgi:hypothetical protein
MGLAARFWPLSICSRAGALLAYLILREEVAATLKSREQREGAETIERGQQEEGSTSKANPDYQKRMEDKAGNSSF